MKKFLFIHLFIEASHIILAGQAQHNYINWVAWLRWPIPGTGINKQIHSWQSLWEWRVIDIHAVWMCAQVSLRHTVPSHAEYMPKICLRAWVTTFFYFEISLPCGPSSGCIAYFILNFFMRYTGWVGYFSSLCSKSIKIKFYRIISLASVTII